jgi:prepilin-type N-terminal cleavage/methylation domain-containing protein
MKSVRLHRCRGFTLIELVYVTVVMGLLGALLVPVVHNSLRSFDLTRKEVTVLDQIRYAMERMAREIREVRFNSSQEVEFSTATSTRLVFTRRAVVGGSAAVVVTLELNGTNLLLGYGSLAIGPQLLLTSVSRLEFIYLDQGLAALALSSPPTVTELADIYAVRIDMDVLSPTGQKLSRRTVVQLKNRELL